MDNIKILKRKLIVRISIFIFFLAIGIYIMFTSSSQVLSFIYGILTYHNLDLVSKAEEKYKAAKDQALIDELIDGNPNPHSHS